MHKTWSALAALLALLSESQAAVRTDLAETMVRLPAGTYTPFYSRESTKSARDGAHRPISVESFWLDRYPVTNAQFLAFVQRNPQWRRSRIARIFADAHYLAHWASDAALSSPGDAARPVTGVSWFAAQAYCKARNQTLPTTDQWEYALADQNRNHKALNAAILAWYSTPTSRAVPPVQTATPNGYGLMGMVGFVWEWTLDFNSMLSGPDLRSTGSASDAKFCGGGSLGAKDASDYASFMRYAMRSSLNASYTTNNMGFRCSLNHP